MPKKSNKTIHSSNGTVTTVLIVGLVAVLLLGALFWEKGVAQFFGLQTTSVTEVKQVTGVYRANLPAADTPGRTITLELQAEGVAVLTQDYGVDDPAIVESGTWSEESAAAAETNNRVRVQLSTRGEEAMAFPQELVFEYLEHNAGVLQLVDYDESQWGTQGLVLQNISALINSNWVWVETVMSDDSKTQTDEDQSFSLSFSEEGRVSITTDCNNGMGAYAVSQENGLEFGPLASTLMYCEGSQESTFFGQLAQVDSYFLDGNLLHLLLKVDSGTMTFEAAPVLAE